MTGENGPAYFMYFPGNYRWSAAFIALIGSIACGGAEIGELHRIGRLLKDKGPEDDDAWFRACVHVADGVRACAERCEKTGHRVSAAHAYLRACSYYQAGERFRAPKDRAALDAYRRGVECFHRHAALTDLKIEIVEVPYENGSLPGYLAHAQNAAVARAPCAVFFGSLDSPKETQFVRSVPDLVKRGLSCLLMDGPGTGEAIRFRNYHLRHDYEVAGSACLDWLGKRADADPRRTGIVATGFGGYFAPRCAAMDPRYAACVAWGAQWDCHETWRRRIEAAFRTPLSVPGHHINWVTGATSLNDALKRLEPFRLDGVMQRLRCPFLLLHGADDEQVPLADARRQFDACGSADRTLRVFTAEEGGAQHGQRDNLALAVAEIGNWLEHKLLRD